MTAHHIKIPIVSKVTKTLPLKTLEKETVYFILTCSSHLSHTKIAISLAVGQLVRRQGACGM